MNLKLTNYRCFDDIKFTIPNSNFILLDDNGSGKTSILSAFYSITTGKPFPNSKFINYLQFNKQYFGISRDNTNCFLNGKISSNGKISTKWINENKNSETVLTYQPTDNLWLTFPRKLKLDILDKIISQSNSSFEILITKLDKIVKSKLALIKKTRQTNQTDLVLVKFLHDCILSLSTQIWQIRQQFLIELQNSLPVFSSFIKNNYQNWNIEWQITNIDGKKIKIRDTKISNVTNILNLDKINFSELWQKESFVEKVLFGAHRDDFEITIERNPVQNILSRGEMRLLVLFVKKTGVNSKNIIWLLDDIFNELDDEREKFLLDNIFVDSKQIIVTGTRCNLKNLLKLTVKDIIVY